MRKITQEITSAFNQFRELKRGNTYTNGHSIWLFGNRIVQRVGDDILISNAGWETSTTKERLNAIEGVNIRQVNGVWLLNGHPWGGEWVNPLTFGYHATTVVHSHPPLLDSNPALPDIEFDVTSEWLDAGYSRPIHSVFHTLVESELEQVEKLLHENDIETKRMESDTDGVYKPNYFIVVLPEKFKQALSILKK